AIQSYKALKWDIARPAARLVARGGRHCPRRAAATFPNAGIFADRDTDAMRQTVTETNDMSHGRQIMAPLGRLLIVGDFLELGVDDAFFAGVSGRRLAAFSAAGLGLVHGFA